MFVTLVTLSCLLGAGLIALICSLRRWWWPLLALLILMAVIAWQLYRAYLGDGSYHDLSALTALHATILPALIGTLTGALAGHHLGAGLLWRNWQAALCLMLLLAITAILIAAWRV